MSVGFIRKLYHSLYPWCVLVKESLDEHYLNSGYSKYRHAFQERPPLYPPIRGCNSCTREKRTNKLGPSMMLYMSTTDREYVMLTLEMTLMEHSVFLLMKINHSDCV